MFDLSSPTHTPTPTPVQDCRGTSCAGTGVCHGQTPGGHPCACLGNTCVDGSLIQQEKANQALYSALTSLSLDPNIYATTTTTYTITVTNMSPYPQNFFFFQQPAVYVGGPQVYANSVGTQQLQGYNPNTPQQIQFTFIQQYRAGAQLQSSPPQIGVAQTGLVSQSLVQLSQGPGDTSSFDSTAMSFDVNGNPILSSAVNIPGVMGGAFRIVTPYFQPAQANYNIGLGGIANGLLVLSNFIVAQPGQNVDVQPIVKFYVSTGAYLPGTVINFTTSSVAAALCDATSGKLSFNVVYNANCTSSVS
jgi:hypothetical protein